MEVLYYDFFIWLNCVAFLLAIVDKIHKGRLGRYLTISAFAFGGLGAALGCTVSFHRFKRIRGFFILGLIEAAIAYGLRNVLFP